MIFGILFAKQAVADSTALFLVCIPFLTLAGKGQRHQLREEEKGNEN